MQLSYGDIWKNENLSFGTLHSLQYSNNYDAKTTLIKKYNAQNATDLVLDESGQINTYENNIKTSYNADFGIKFSQNKINFNYLNLLDTSHEVAIKNYSVVGDSVDARRKSSSEWAERNLERKQLQGEHPLLTGWTLDWKLQSSSAKRTAPDSKEVTYLKRSTQYELNTDTTGNRRQYDYLNDRTEEQSLALENKWLNQKTKIGFLVSQRKRISDTYRFHFKNKTNDTNQMDLTKDFDTLLNEEKKLNGFELMSITDSADSYQGEQNLSSRFIWHEGEWNEKIQFGLGLREENNLTRVQTFYYYDRSNPLSSSQVKTKDLLPAANLSYSFNENLKARLAFSKTLARPDFRELSTAPFIDPDSGFETIGNPFLKTTVIENWDHRYEYYWKTDEYISLGYFLKKFSHPIESQFEPSPNLRKTFANSKTATNHGVEFETRNNLRFLTRDLRWFYFQSNLALIDSKVDLSDDLLGLQTSKNRPLQGQSPYIFNLQLIYENKKEKLSAALIYNEIGKRITEVGTQGRPDVYEMENGQFDFNSNYALNSNNQFNFKIKNLFDPEIKSQQGNEVVKLYKKGTQLALSWSYTM